MTARSLSSLPPGSQQSDCMWHGAYAPSPRKRGEVNAVPHAIACGSPGGVGRGLDPAVDLHAKKD